MENPTLDDPMEGAGVAAAPPGLVSASCSEGIGSSGGGSPPLGGTPATAARQRKPGRWKRFPRVVPPTHSEHALKFPNAQPPPGTTNFAPFLPSFWAFQPPPPMAPEQTTPQRKTFQVVYARKGSREYEEAMEESNQEMLNYAKQLEEAEDDDDWDDEARIKFRAFKAKFVPFYRRLATTRPEDVVFNTKPPSDTREEHLTAEEMEMEADRSGWLVCPQACHFATLALEHYNSSKKTVHFPKVHFPKGHPPPGTKKFAPFLPSFWAFQPPPSSTAPEETTPQRETAPTPQRETFRVVYVTKGSREDKEAEERSNQKMLKFAKQLEEAEDDDDWDEEARAKFRTFKEKFVPCYRRLATTRSEDVIFNTKPPNDTREEHLTAEDMEVEADRSRWPVCPQACHFATLALEHYNSSKKTHKFEMTKVLLSKCFSEADGTTFAHVNFTAATPQKSASHPAKRLFFAELMLVPDLQAYDCIEPMRVLHVCTIDDSCFGGCHEMVRDIKGPVSEDMDYDRCHACSQRIKHPRGAQFIAGHNRTRMPYFSVFP